MASGHRWPHCGAWGRPDWEGRGACLLLTVLHDWTGGTSVGPL